MTAPVHERDIYVTANGLRHHVIARGRPGFAAMALELGTTGAIGEVEPLNQRGW